MIKTKEDLKHYLKEDRIRNGILSRRDGFLGRIVHSENVCAYRYISCMRRCEYHLNNSVSLYHKIIYAYYKFRLLRLGRKYNIMIRPNTCGYGLRILHLSGGGGVLLNVNKVGNYCGFNSGVLIGNSGGADKRPTIGDYVGFGPGSKAFGDIYIGDHVFVAPNAVVVKDVPADFVVGGVPAKVIKSNC